MFAILLVALAPTVSQFAMSLRHDGHHAHEHAASMQADEHAGHAPHAQEAQDAPPGDCWSACGYCELFSHVPALELPPCGELVAVDLPAIAIDSDRRAPASVVQWRTAQPRGPPLQFA
jgi:hypothetical protein